MMWTDRIDIALENGGKFTNAEKLLAQNYYYCAISERPEFKNKKPHYDNLTKKAIELAEKFYQYVDMGAAAHARFTLIDIQKLKKVERKKTV